MDMKDSQNKTALFYAIESENGENSDILSTILKKNPDVNIVNKKDQSPVAIAVEKGYSQSVRLLLEHGANVSVGKKGESLVDIAKRKKFKDIVKMLQEGEENHRKKVKILRLESEDNLSNQAMNNSSDDGDAVSPIIKKKGKIPKIRVF